MVSIRLLKKFELSSYHASGPELGARKERDGQHGHPKRPTRTVTQCEMQAIRKYRMLAMGQQGRSQQPEFGRDQEGFYRKSDM